MIDAAENTVAAILGFGGRDKVDAVFEIRNGKIALGRENATRSEALEAAGLAA